MVDDIAGIRTSFRRHNAVNALPIRAVCFDVGETLIDETRHWMDWTALLGDPAITLFTAVGVTMERVQSFRPAFEILKPCLGSEIARQ